ncbi:EamA family transporter RarD [Amphritea sp. 1_MG-2023]|uniref:EamA family transporter RarD n=1 Tax=Amphritea sp. 1_MG-2023 TaxID=3062670 RepID=UPI0026E2401C|nr:EamA family transporter RarD [Amphritea sp. 1_MG-2023]MDO6563728.1 EamA family transporter RarD [Amphritea sp. 1_MG-2023]
MKISQQEQNQGILFALAAYSMWGLIPVYFKLVDSVSPFEVVAHRVIWSVIFLALFMAATGRWQTLLGNLRQKKLLASLTVSAIIISFNWLVFIWAVAQERILEASLGYYINPLISVLLGMIFLGERLRIAQWLAILIATAGVAYQLILLGSLPWVALALAFSFGFYGLLRKRIVVDPFCGLLIETLILSPIALIYLFWLHQQGQLTFIHSGSTTMLLLAAAGIVTSLPLICFAAGARRLTLTMNGLLQYIAPSIAFLLAVLVYHEPLNSERLITFACIWLGLVLFTAESLWRNRKIRIKPVIT